MDKESESNTNPYFGVCLDVKGRKGIPFMVSPYFCTEKAAELWARKLVEIPDGLLFKHLGIQRHSLELLKVIKITDRHLWLGYQADEDEDDENTKDVFDNEWQAWEKVMEDLGWYEWLNDVVFADSKLDHCPCCAEELPEYPLIEDEKGGRK